MSTYAADKTRVSTATEYPVTEQTICCNACQL